MVKEKQKWRSIAVTDIITRGDTIFTAGIDGEIKKLIVT